MNADIKALRGEIKRLAAAPDGVMKSRLLELDYTDKQLKNTLYPMMAEGLIWSFRKEHSGIYFDSEARMLEAKKAWEAGARERLLQSWRERSAAKYAKLKLDAQWAELHKVRGEQYREAKRNEKKAAGTYRPRGASKPSPAPHQKPYVAAPVTIKASGRGPAYLPGEPKTTSRTIYTYGKSPTNPTHTTTHAE